MFSLSSKSEIASKFQEDFKMYKRHDGTLVFKIGEGFSEKINKPVVFLMDHNRKFKMVEREFFEGKTFSYTKGFVPRFEHL